MFDNLSYSVQLLHAMKFLYLPAVSIMQETESTKAAAAAAEAAEEQRFTAEMRHYLSEKEAFYARWEVFAEALTHKASITLQVLLPHYETLNPVSFTLHFEH